MKKKKKRQNTFQSQGVKGIHEDSHPPDQNSGIEKQFLLNDIPEHWPPRTTTTKTPRNAAAKEQKRRRLLAVTRGAEIFPRYLKMSDYANGPQDAPRRGRRHPLHT